MTTLVTGAAGFVGFHTVRRLLDRGDEVVAIDNLDPYYDPALKRARVAELNAHPAARRLSFIEGDIGEPAAVDALFAAQEFERVIHLAAQPGVRYSLDNPRAYIRNNVDAFLNVLEACRHASTPHLTYASSSSVYGANRKIPFHEDDDVGHPLAIYGVTKRANELMAHSYSHLYGLPTTGLRFFTVYGPWGRPDMAPFLFTRNILAGQPIEVFNHGRHSRDFTYIDDIVEGVVRSSDQICEPDPDWDARAPRASTSASPFRIFNIGNSEPVQLDDFIRAIEAAVGRQAVRVDRPMQAGDVTDTCADVTTLERVSGYRPQIGVEEGVARFVRWFREFYGL